MHGFQTHTDTEALNHTEKHRTIPSVLGDFLLALLPFLLQLLEVRNHHGHQLQNNGCTDVGHNAQGKNGKPLQCPPGKHVKHANNAIAVFRKNIGQGIGIDSGCGNVNPNAVDKQQHQGRYDPLLQFR